MKYLPHLNRGAVLLLLCLLASCGVKPGHVDPPEGAPSNYPRTYPNPAE